MPSRINIGPENGPYVAINESSGNLQLEDNSGNVVAEWDETNAQWDFANNTLNNVDALNSNSVNTGDLENEDGDPDRRFNRIERDVLDADETLVTFDDLDDQKEYKIWYSWRLDFDSGDRVFVRFNGDDDDNYVWYDSSLTENSGENEIVLYEPNNNFVPCVGNLIIGAGRFDDPQVPGLFHEIVSFRPSRVDDFGRHGVFDVTTGISSIELHIEGGFISDGDAVVELWERDYQ